MVGQIGEGVSVGPGIAAGQAGEQLSILQQAGQAHSAESGAGLGVVDPPPV